MALPLQFFNIKKFIKLSFFLSELEKMTSELIGEGYVAKGVSCPMPQISRTGVSHYWDHLRRPLSPGSGHLKEGSGE